VLLSLIPMLPYNWRLEARTQITNAIDELPHEAKLTVREYVLPKLQRLIFDKSPAITLIWIGGLLMTMWAASGGVAMTMGAMDRCYDVQRVRPFYKQRPLAVVLTFVIALLIIAVVVLIPVGTIVTNYLTQGTERLLTATKLGKPAVPGETPKQAAATVPAAAPGAVPGAVPSTTPAVDAITTGMIERPHTFAVWIVLWQVARYGVALLLLFWIVALMYHFGPNVKQRFRVLTPGSVFTVAVWILLGVTFRMYVERFGKYGETYGAVGGVIILLFFFYIDALVLLVGAEINSEVDCALRADACEREKPPPPEVIADTEPARETP
jgi:uncharacterized BrkB/YihY/UPF0761 family membrane protein